MKDYTVCINETGLGIRKILKVTPYKTGGFGVMVPYHTAKAAYLAELLVRYDQHRYNVRAEHISVYTASDRVKLSVHADGFVQFSSERGNNIISGRDPITGEPKGLGILSNPIHNPITTGPTWGGGFWGLTDFELLATSPKSNTLIFTETDFYYRGSNPDTWRSYALEAFMFPNSQAEFVQHKADKSVITLYFPNYQHSPRSPQGAWFTFRLLPLPNQPVFMGIIISRIDRIPARPNSDGQLPASGFYLGGPSEIDPRKHTLYASYPELFPGESRGSLDYEPPEPDNTEELFLPPFR